MKTTTITCDRCGAASTGKHYARHWARLRRIGWVKGYGTDVHYCPDCAGGKGKE